MGEETDEVDSNEVKSEHLFSQKMRLATRHVHTTSDHLVNAKLGVTMSDDSVWAEGLLVFYEIFAFLEKALVDHSDSLLGDLLIPGMARSAAIEADLSHYLGQDWRESYTVRPEVQDYLEHLKNLEKDRPYLLIPYIYHLYMALFSGGQVMKAKRMLMSGGRGSEVLNFGDVALGTLKKQMRKSVNDVAEELDDDTKEDILKESVEVFKRNNVIIGSVEGVDRVLKRRLIKLLIAVLMLLLFIFAWFAQSEEEEHKSDSIGNDDKAVEL